MHPRRPSGNTSGRQLGRHKRRGESFQARSGARAPGTLPVLGNFRRADSPDLTDCPGVSEDGFNVNQLTVRMSHDILCYAN